jgi:hypothetical protein
VTRGGAGRLLATVLSVSLAAPLVASSPQSPARRERAVPFAPGERLEYDVSWSHYLSAGTIVMRVEDKRPSFGSVAYYVVAEAHTAGLVSRLYTLYYKADTLLDAYSLLPQRGSIFSREGSRQRMKATSFDHGARRARFEMQTATRMEADLAIPTTTQDALSALYALRAAGPRPGDRVRLPVADSGKLYDVTFQVGPRETLTLQRRPIGVLRVTPSIVGPDGEAVAPGTTLWLADDASRKVVRMDVPMSFGRVVLTLRTQ